MLANSQPERLVWTPEREEAYEHLKQRVTSSPVLIQPDFRKRFYLECDASNTGIGGVLSQQVEVDGKVVYKPVSFLSRKLNKAEQNYSTREREMLAIVWCVERLRDWLWGKPFTVFTDHKSLIWVKTAMMDHGRLTRWALKLSDFQFDIEYKPGAQNAVADCLSRIHVISFARRKDGKVVLNQSTDPRGKQQRKRKRKATKARTAPAEAKVEPSEVVGYLRGKPAPSRVLPLAVGADVEAEVADIAGLEGDPEDSKVGEGSGPSMPARPEPVRPGSGEGERAHTPSSAPFAGSSSHSGEAKNEAPGMVADRDRKGTGSPVLGPAGLEIKGYEYVVPDVESWRNLLVHDLQYRVLIQYMMGKYSPPTVSQADALKRAKGFYKLADGLLYYIRSREGGKESPLYVVPEACRRPIVMLYHNHPAMGGHRAWETVRAKIQEKFWWPTMTNDIKSHVANCPECFWAKAKVSKSGLLVNFLATVGKMEVLHIDFVGPISSTSQAGNRFILTMKDRGSGWIELVACPDQTALTTAKVILRGMDHAIWGPQDLDLG